MAKKTRLERIEAIKEAAYEQMKVIIIEEIMSVFARNKTLVTYMDQMGARFFIDRNEENVDDRDSFEKLWELYDEADIYLGVTIHRDGRIEE